MAFFVVLNVISFLFYPAFMPWFENQEEGEEVIDQTIDADKAIQDYEWFRTQYHEIQAQRAQLQNARDELKRFYDVHGEDPEDWSRQAREDHSRIQQRITGNQNQLERLIGEYNARSDTATREIFKCSLPFQVEDNLEVQGPPGSGSPDEASGVEAYDEKGNKIEVERVPPSEECDGLPDQIQQGGN